MPDDRQLRTDVRDLRGCTFRRRLYPKDGLRLKEILARCPELEATRRLVRVHDPQPQRRPPGGPHPNPRKAAEGYRPRLLAVDEASAEVVSRIFVEYMDGRGDRAIANGLNRDGILCPSARRPEQNRHRLADGWQGK
jgi:hypothetical protein